MEKAIYDLKTWWNENAFGVLSDVGEMDRDEVRDYVGDTCTAFSFISLSPDEQEEALVTAFQEKKYSI